MIPLWLRNLFCRHSNLDFVRNIYGDEIIELGNKRSQWKCRNCGSTVYRDNLK